MKDLFRYFIEASGEAAERAAEIAKQLAPLTASYLRALGWLMLAVLTFPLSLLILGIAGNLGWLVSIVGIFWALATFLLLFIAAPLGILIEAVLGSVKGSGRRYVQLALGVLCVELTFALFVTVIPVGANWRIIPLLLVAAGILGILGAKGTRTILTKRVVSVTVSLVFILLTLTLFYPKTFSVLQEAIPRSDEQIAGGFVALTDSAGTSSEGSRTEHLTGQSITPQMFSICGDTTYKFHNQSKISVALRPDCWSGWVITPAGSAWRVDASEGGWAENWFVDESVFRIEPGEPYDVGVRRGIFRLRGEGTATITVSSS